MKKGLFITFEGGEGVSKSTQAKLLNQYFLDLGIQTVLTREPGGTKFGEEFRQLILHNEVAPRTELLAMMSARNQHIEEVIKPAIDMAKIVICDRFVDSTACYQTISSELTAEVVYELHAEILDNFLPDLTILLDLAPEAALPRAKARNPGLLDKNEAKDISYHLSIYEKYKALAVKFPHRIKIVDASRSVEEIFADIVKLVNNIKLAK